MRSTLRVDNIGQLGSTNTLEIRKSLVAFYGGVNYLWTELECEKNLSSYTDSVNYVTWAFINNMDQPDYAYGFNARGALAGTKISSNVNGIYIGAWQRATSQMSADSLNNQTDAHLIDREHQVTTVGKLA